MQIQEERIPLKFSQRQKRTAFDIRNVMRVHYACMGMAAKQPRRGEMLGRVG